MARLFFHQDESVKFVDISPETDKMLHSCRQKSGASFQEIANEILGRYGAVCEEFIIQYLSSFGRLSNEETTNFLQNCYNRFIDAGGDHGVYVAWNDLPDDVAEKLRENYKSARASKPDDGRSPRE